MYSTSSYSQCTHNKNCAAPSGHTECIPYIWLANYPHALILYYTIKATSMLLYSKQCIQNVTVYILCHAHTHAHMHVARMHTHMHVRTHKHTHTHSAYTHTCSHTLCIHEHMSQIVHYKHTGKGFALSESIRA